MAPSEKKVDKTATRKQANKPVKDAAVHQQVEAAQSSNEVFAKPSSASLAAGRDTAGDAAKAAAAEAVIVSETGSETMTVAPAAGELVVSAAAPAEPTGGAVPVSKVTEIEPTVRGVLVSKVTEIERPVSIAPLSTAVETEGLIDTLAEPAVSATPVSAVAAVEEIASKAAVSRIAEVEPTVGEAPGGEAPVSAVASEAPGRETAATEQPVSEAPPPASVPAIAIVQPLEEPRHEEPKYVRPPLENKYLNKEALRDRLWLRKEFKPIISYVGRLDYQKGVHLIRHGIFYALHHGAQFVLLGVSPEHRINEEFWHLKHQLNDSPDCHLEIGFNEELSHLIYAGSDMIIMPSLYEPCGLTQMIALKYGTVPIVRAVGGLVDTVFDRDYSSRPPEERNGYVFHEADAAGLESAMSRAIGLWYSYPDEFRKLIVNGMKYDYSWNYPGQHYLNIYEYIRCK